MSVSSTFAGEHARTPASKWPWFVALGVAMIVLGVIAWCDVVAVTLASTIVIGAAMLVGGVFQVIHAFMSKGWRDLVLGLLLGALYIAGGLLIISEPVQGAIVLTLLLSAVVIVGGVVRIILALRHRHLRTWWLVLLSGIVSLAVGVLIYVSLPWSGLWVLGTLIAIELIIQGVGWVSFGMTLRAARPA
jgi:uncharacterized membrane protein HdeD (DUF308 family)